MENSGRPVTLLQKTQGPLQSVNSRLAETGQSRSSH